MIAVLDGTTDLLTATLAGAPATTQPTYSALWNGNGGPAQAIGLLTGVTAKTMLAGVGGGPRVLDSLHIYNSDTAAVVATINKSVAGTSYPLVNAEIPVGGTLRWLKDGLSILDAGATTPADSVGAIVAGIGLSVTESGSGSFRRTVLTLTNTPITITDALAYASLKLYDFPAGRLRIIDCLTSLAFTTTSTIASTLNSGATVSHGIGSVAASSITLATTMMNMMPGSGEAVNNFTSSTTINVAAATVTGKLAAVAGAQHAAILDGTSTPVDLYLNLGVPTNTEIDADATLTVSGTIQITWINGGDL
jgi:hypothetical protein